MPLPAALSEAVEALLAAGEAAALERAAGELTSAYRAGAPAGALASPARRLAYLAVRLPATWAAVQAALVETLARLEPRPRSLLDLGAGPGTAAWAAAELLDLEGVTLVEREAELCRLGQRLLAQAPQPALRGARWERAELQAQAGFEPHDLVVASYVLGELPEREAALVARAAYAAARGALLLVEPGTPAGFARLRFLRQELLAQGAHVLAPCPHDAACPMPPGDWCHFAARLERTSRHRRLKLGARGHEDEKYAYVALGPRPAAPATARVLRHPQRRGGHVLLDLCTAGGLARAVVARRDAAAWPAARRARWGDAWEPGAGE